MIYLVTKNQNLTSNTLFKIITVQESINKILLWDVVQIDSEPSGRDPHVCDLLCFQFGNKKRDEQIIIDCKTIQIENYKEVLEKKLLIGHNLKFDFQFLYKHNIIPLNVWDTMIVEQLLFLGYTRDPVLCNDYIKYGFNFPYKEESIKNIGLCRILNFSLEAIALNRLNIKIDKSARGEIIWNGLNSRVVLYAAIDVKYLEDIKTIQELDLEKTNSKIAACVENNFVPAIAYLEWCGIKVDANKILSKFENDLQHLKEYRDRLDNYIISRKDIYSKFIIEDTQLNLFEDGVSVQCSINWANPNHIIPLLKQMGFNLYTRDSRTGVLKESISDNLLISQKGVNDQFLSIYFKYKEYERLCSPYYRSYIDSINPITGRIHSVFWQLGSISGRMSCGSSKINSDLARFKKTSSNYCIYPQLQNISSDPLMRQAFVSENGNLFTSCDFSSLEARLGADIYNEPNMINEFLNGSNDIYSVCAKLMFPEKLKNINIADIQEKYGDLREVGKSVALSQQFGGGIKAIQNQLSCTREKAAEFYKIYSNTFKNIAEFKKKGSSFVRKYGYIVMCNKTGHRVYWPWFKQWKVFSNTFHSSNNHEMDSMAAYYDRLALNSPTQGSGAIILKIATTAFFKWIVKNNYFNKVKICNLIHDEICVEYPEKLKNIVELKLKEAMEKSANLICRKLPIPAKSVTNTYWCH